MGSKSSSQRVDDNNTNYIPCTFNPYMSTGFTFSTNKQQNIAKINSLSMCKLYLNASTLYQKTNEWKIQFKNCKYTFIRINFFDKKNRTNEINKTLPGNLPTSFNIIVTFDRTDANQTKSGWDQLKVKIPSIDSEISAQKRQFETQDLMMDITLISSIKTAIKAWNSIYNISQSIATPHIVNVDDNQHQKAKKTRNVYDDNVLVLLVYGFIREIENNLLELKRKNQTVPFPIKDLVFSFTDLFNKHCNFYRERCQGFRFETLGDVHTAIGMQTNLRLWIEGKTKFGEEYCWKFVFEDCEKHFLRIQFDNREKIHYGYDTIGKNIMIRPDKLVDLPNPFTIIVILDRKDIYKNQYFIDDKDDNEVKRRKTKFGRWDRLKIKFIDIHYEINAERPQLIDDLELNLHINSSSHCTIQAWNAV